jgi:hypothetical protein
MCLPPPLLGIKIVGKLSTKEVTSASGKTLKRIEGETRRKRKNNEKP